MAIPTIMLVHRDEDGRMLALPFAYQDGDMHELSEGIAAYLIEHDLGESFWREVAIDRGHTILELRAHIRELAMRKAAYA